MTVLCIQTDGCLIKNRMDDYRVLDALAEIVFQQPKLSTSQLEKNSQLHLRSFQHKATPYYFYDNFRILGTNSCWRCRDFRPHLENHVHFGMVILCVAPVQ